VPGEGLQRLVAVHENHGVVMVQEVFRRSRAPCARAEVVHEPHRIVLQGNCGAAGLELKDEVSIKNLTNDFLL